MMIAKERIFLTADRKRAVAEGHKDAAFLFAAPGDEVPDSAVEAFGLVDGKAKAAPANKAKKAGANKGDGAPAGDDLTRIAGIGGATAKALAAAGYTSFASLGAVDPASPPSIEGLPAAFKWADVVEAAKGLAE